MSTQIQLGEEVTREDRTYRAVRIVTSFSLFETPEGVMQTQQETYLMLKSEQDVLFETLFLETLPYEGPPSSIKAPTPITWRPK